MTRSRRSRSGSPESTERGQWPPVRGTARDTPQDTAQGTAQRSPSPSPPRPVQRRWHPGPEALQLAAWAWARALPSALAQTLVPAQKRSKCSRDGSPARWARRPTPRPLAWSERWTQMAHHAWTSTAPEAPPDYAAAAEQPQAWTVPQAATPAPRSELQPERREQHPALHSTQHLPPVHLSIHSPFGLRAHSEPHRHQRGQRCAVAQEGLAETSAARRPLQLSWASARQNLAERTTASRPSRGRGNMACRCCSRTPSTPLVLVAEKRYAVSHSGLPFSYYSFFDAFDVATRLRFPGHGRRFQK